MMSFINKGGATTRWHDTKSIFHFWRGVLQQDDVTQLNFHFWVSIVIQLCIVLHYQYKCMCSIDKKDKKGFIKFFFKKKNWKNVKIYTNDNYMVIFFYLLLDWYFTMRQTYFRQPKYFKNYIIQNPRNLYEKFVNTFAFCEMVNTKNEKSSKKEFQKWAQSNWWEINMKDKDFI